MASTIRTVKIPDGAWAIHKDAILSLFLTTDLPLRAIMKAMKDNYGFEATIFQYESQLRAWKARRNLRVHEWRPILRILDKVPQGTESRVMLFGKHIPEKRVRRARRNCKGKPESLGGLEGNAWSDEPLDAFVEVRQPNGTWVRFTGAENAGSIPPLPQLEDLRSYPTSTPVDQLPNIEEIEWTGQNTDLVLRSPPNFNHSIESPFKRVRIDTSAVEDWNEFLISIPTPINLEWEEYDATTPSGHVRLSPGPSFDCFSDYLRASYNFPSGPFLWLNELSFNMLERQLDMLVEQGMKYRGSHLLATDQNVVDQFRILLERSQRSPKYPQQKRKESPRIEYDLRNLGTLLPGRTSQPEHGSGRVVTSINGADDAVFVRALIFSMANGSVRLQKVPLGPVLRFLAHTEGLKIILNQLLKVEPRYCAKAFAETVFKAAIEIGEDEILRQVLSTSLIDVNRIVLFFDGVKYTALELAARLQNLTSIEILLNSNADPKRTARVRSGPLGDALGLYDSQLRHPVTKEWLGVRDLLLRRYPLDAHDPMRINVELWKSFEWTPEAIRQFIAAASPEEYPRLVRMGLLEAIAVSLEDIEAAQMVPPLLEVCLKTCRGSWPIQYAEEIGDGLIASVMIGRPELTILLIPWCQETRTREALELLIQLGQTDVEGIARKHIKNNIFPAPSKKPVDLSKFVSRTTAQVCDIGLVEKFLSRSSYADSEERVLALALSIKYGYDEVAFKLLDTGVSVNRGPRPKSDRVYDSQLPLELAIERRSVPLIRAILDADIGYRGVSSSAFKEAFLWGDISIIKELMVASSFVSNCHGNARRPFSIYERGFKTQSLSPKVVSEIDKTGDRDLLDLALSLLCTTQSFHSAKSSFRRAKLANQLSGLEETLAHAIENRNEPLVETLLACGADATNDFTLKSAIRSSPRILQLLLQHVDRRKSKRIFGFGMLALQQAIKDGLSNREYIDILLTSGIIDLNSPVMVQHDSSQRIIFPPLGTAIEYYEGHSVDGLVIIKKLLDAGCNTERISAAHNVTSGTSSHTPLLQAIGARSPELVQLFIDYGANVHATVGSTLKRTPLQKAAEAGSIDIVKLLLEHNADVNAAPSVRSGGTALQFAAISGNCNIAAELLSRGAHLYAPPSKVHGRWPIEGAAEHGRLHMIEYLWTAKENTVSLEGCETGFEEKHCRKAMKLAEKNGHLACRDLIAEKAGFNVESV